MNPNNPREFYPWLAKLLSGPGLRCVKTDPSRPDGILAAFSGEDGETAEFIIDMRKYAAGEEGGSWLAPVNGANAAASEKTAAFVKSRLAALAPKLKSLPLLTSWDGIKPFKKSVHSESPQTTEGAPVCASAQPSVADDDFFNQNRMWNEKIRELGPMEFLNPYEIESECSLAFHHLKRVYGDVRILMTIHQQCVNTFNFTPSKHRLATYSPWDETGGTAGSLLIEPIYLTKEALFGDIDEIARSALESETTDWTVLIKMCFDHQLGIDSDWWIATARKTSGKGVILVDLMAANDEKPKVWSRLLYERDKLLEPYKPKNGDLPFINLVGYAEPRGATADELSELLTAAGLRINHFVVPGCDLSVERPFSAAAFTAVFPWKHVERCLWPEAMAGLNAAKIPAPYGYAATVKWLNSLREKAKAPSSAPQSLEELYRIYKKRYEETAQRASKVKILVVADGEEGTRLLQPERRYGVDVPHFLSDLGFDVAIIVNLKNEKDAAALEYARQRWNVEVRSAKNVSTPEKAAALLRNSGFDAVYGERWNDKRVIASGLGQITPELLEMGFKGGLRTAERIIRLAKRPALAEYAARRSGGEANLA